MAKTFKKVNGKTYVRDGNRWAGRVGGSGSQAPSPNQETLIASDVSIQGEETLTFAEQHAKMLAAGQVVELGHNITAKVYSLDELSVVDPAKYSTEIQNIRDDTVEYWGKEGQDDFLRAELAAMGEPELNIEHYPTGRRAFYLVGEMRIPEDIQVMLALSGAPSMPTITVGNFPNWNGWASHLQPGKQIKYFLGTDIGPTLMNRKSNIVKELTRSSLAKYVARISDRAILEFARAEDLVF